MNTRREIEHLIKKKKEFEEMIDELAYILYEEEVGNEMEGLPVKCFGPKRVLRKLGFVI